MSGNDSGGIRARLFVALQHVMPQHFLSRLVYHLTRSRTPLLKDMLIRAFMHEFHPDMQQALEPEPLRYPSFNDFFTRGLRPGCRPADPDPATLVSPVDGQISQIGSLDGSRLLQAKGHYYSLEALLGVEAGSHWAQRFSGGAFTTLYLAPSNYHRVHMPLAGTLCAAWYLPGSLFSVNTVTAALVPGLFARNERVVCVFDGEPVSFAMVLVGALFVGSMSTVWHGEITPRSPRRRHELPLDNASSPLRLGKGAEMGRFNMGSTVILVLPRGSLDWLRNRQAKDRIVVGETLAQLHSS